MANGSKLPRRARSGPLFKDLPQRARLTIKHHGWREFVARLVASPFRLVGLERTARARLSMWSHERRVRSWYRTSGRPVTIVIPTYGDPSTTIDATGRLRRTVEPTRTQIVVVDDGSEPQHQARLRNLRGIRVELAPENRGYAAGVNRGLALAPSDHDVVVLNNDVIGHRRWLEKLQYAVYTHDQTGVVGPMLLYPDGRIQAAGAHRNLGSPQWFDHRYRFKRSDFGPAGVSDRALAVTGACMYLRRSLIDELGEFDEGFPMAYEDVDYCLRAWEAGWEVRYEPTSRLTHVESPTRGTEVGERELRSQDHFWERWGGWFDRRSVRTEGRLRVVYVTQDTGVGGGHRDVFEHLNRLRNRGHEAELFSLAGPPDWYPLEAPVRTFQSYQELAAALAPLEALKVATWWETAPWVWRASVTRGIPVYFVQDIETSYYPGDERTQHRVLASYREEFRFMTISTWNRERLAELGLSSDLIPPGIDLDNFRRLDRPERDDVVLAIGRSLPLKNLPLTVAAWQRLDPRPELWMFGVEPELGPKYGARYFERPSDEHVNELFNEAGVFVQTSIHEGFGLPLLEAMATGTPVVSTDAHGNRDFCRHEENCLIADATPEAVSHALARVLGDPQLRARLIAAGLETAKEYDWERRIDRLERFFVELAEARPRAPRLSGAPRG